MGRSKCILIKVSVIWMSFFLCVLHCSKGRDLSPDAGDKQLSNQVARPQFRPDSGKYTQDIEVEITCATNDSLIYYTVDGSIPNSDSPLYTGSVKIDGNMADTVIKAVAYKTGLKPSEIAVANYQVEYIQMDPVVFFDGENNPISTNGPVNYSSDQKITMVAPVEDAVIFYTIDNTEPDESSLLYTVPVELSGPASHTFIKAYASAPGYLDSNVYTVEVFVNYEVVSSPGFSVDQGTYDHDLTLTISTSTPGATIYYTTDNSDPSVSATRFVSVEKDSIQLKGDMWGSAQTYNVRALAAKQGMADSHEEFRAYTIDYPRQGQISTNFPDQSSLSGQDIVYLNASTGSEIYYSYTTDESDPIEPDASNNQGGGADEEYINMDKDTYSEFPDGSILKLKVVSIKPAHYIQTLARTYSIEWNTLVEPSINYTTGTYSKDINDIVIATSPLYEVRYTLDEPAPLTIDDGIPFNPGDSISVTGHGTTKSIKWVAFADGYRNSPASESLITINWDTVSTPTFTPFPGSYNTDPLSVSISTNTIGANIRYTVNEGDPSPSYGTLYSGALSLGTGTSIVRAIAYKEGMQDSTVAIESFVVDTVAPQIGGNLAIDNVGGNSVALSWTAASDSVTAQNNLQYLVYYSSLDNIATIDDAKSNGIPWGTWQTNATVATVTDLQDWTMFYFNVLVRDESGNESAYVSVSTRTSDITGPDPGNVGAMSSANIDFTSFDLSWTKATDNRSLQNALEYQVYWSDSPNINTLTEIKNNGTPIDSYAPDIDSKSISGLTGNATYYFNVVVKDELNNQSAYAMLAVDTLNLKDHGDHVSIWSLSSTWLKCTAGQSWDGNTCTGTGWDTRFCSTKDNACQAGGTDTGKLISGSLYNACDYFNNTPVGGLGGLANWQVPSRTQLYNFWKNHLISHPQYFPNNETSQNYWTGTGVSGDNTRAVYCDVSYGGISCNDYGIWKTTFINFRTKCFTPGIY